jgi:hypothetical protein
MRDAGFSWTRPGRVERAGGKLQLGKLEPYDPAKIPALWLRVADLATDQGEGWLRALKMFGPIDDLFSEEPEVEEVHRCPWVDTLDSLSVVAALWQEGEDGVWALPAAPLAVRRGYATLQTELALLAHGTTRGRDLKIVPRGLELAVEPTTLRAHLWLSAAASVRGRERFKRCEHCGLFFPIARMDTRFCSVRCRNWRPSPAAEVA